MLVAQGTRISQQVILVVRQVMEEMTAVIVVVLKQREVVRVIEMMFEYEEV